MGLRARCFHRLDWSRYIIPSQFVTRANSPIRLDFLGSSRLGCQNLSSYVLDFLGFPWILSSESSLFNGLYGINAEIIFLGLLPLAAPDRGYGHKEEQECSSGECSSISDLPQAIVVGARSQPHAPEGGLLRTESAAPSLRQRISQPTSTSSLRCPSAFSFAIKAAWSRARNV
jgi:hypothetical protein